MSEHHRLNAAEIRYLAALHAAPRDRRARKFVRDIEEPPSYLIEAGLIEVGRFFPHGLPRLTADGKAWHAAVFRGEDSR